MRLWKILFYSLCLPFLMSISAWSQTDAEGRNFAWQLHQAASQGGNQGQFERMFMQNPQMTKRAFVSTMEYATEIYQQDMNGASQAVAFANQLATLIGQQFGDNTPSSLMQRLMRQDASVMADFASYASSLYPGYAAQGAGYGPGGANPGYQPGYGPGGNPGYGPGGANPGYQPGYGPGGNPGYGPGGANPGYQPGYGPGGNPGYGPGGANPGYQPGYGPGGNPGYSPGGANPGGYPPGYGPGGNPPGGYQPGYGPGGNPGGYQPGYGPGGAPGGYPPNQGPGGYPNSSGNFRPSNTTGGPSN